MNLFLQIAIVNALVCVAALAALLAFRRAMRRQPVLPLTPREKAVATAAAVVPLVLLAVWLANGTEPDASPTERFAFVRNETERNETERLPDPAISLAVPPERYTGERQAEFAQRWITVYAEIGPPPHESAVPVAGYTSKGRYYPSRWRMPPDGTTANNRRP